MRRYGVAPLWSGLLGMVLLWTAPALAQQVFSPPLRQVMTLEEVLQDLAQATVIYLGETHDRPADHETQLDLIRQLHRKNPRLAIGLEMFQRPYQPVLDQYLAGRITEEELRQQSQYDQRWGYPWSYYAPILRYAREHRLPLLALNSPSEITRKVARQGLESLTAAERAMIPPIAELRTDNVAYRRMMRQIYEGIHKGQSASGNFERFFLAQVLWDETMAETIARFLTAQPDYQVVVLAGQGHVVHGYGIPDRVARRMRRSTFQQRTLILNPPPEEKAFNDPTIADYLWVSDD
ncbi:hypothetical protein BST81_11195 [Leptolyngbya sp. 'hensonii']|uniref:ChaN family lipoprotein n=1 Tax=Leptolyngbya sp. 'hensonii' TaxID=1922337 RepID=UPI00094FA690|nr:ChaN family lipoprotein [Leptolyngbya sp. 'hensonii']OLP18353.1 hypothetical protein BST81_11195 [Leptolyngbya sp. 'hensonii']